jgi:hypothetical protein
MMAKSDPEKYRLLSAARTPDEVNAALTAFFEEMGALREKHGIPDVVTICGVNAQYESGIGNAVIWSHYGDSTRAESLLAWAFGQAQVERLELINRLASGKK